MGVRFTTSRHVEEDDRKVAGGAGEGVLVAWAFISSDGSLSSLHVEKEHRGKGIAKAVCRRSFEMLEAEPEAMGFGSIPASALRSGEEEMGEGRDGMGDWEKIRACGAQGWVSSDIAEDNEQSRGVARSVGGIEVWDVRWVGVDLRAVEMAVEDLEQEKS